MASRSFSIFFDSLMIKSGFKAGSVCEKNKQTNKNLVVGFSCFKKQNKKALQMLRHLLFFRYFYRQGEKVKGRRNCHSKPPNSSIHQSCYLHAYEL